MKSIELVHEVECRAAPEAVWRAVSDTDGLNRAAGMSPVEIAPVDGEAGSRMRIRTRLDGFPVTFDEEPFEWHAPDSFVVRRHMREGVLDRLMLGAEVSPREGGGARVRWTLSLDVKYALLVPIARFLGVLRLRSIAAATQRFDAALLSAEPPREPAPFDDERIARVARALEAALPERDRPLARRLVAHATEAPEQEVLRIRPFELADRWGADRSSVLAACLEGVVAGLLQMYWDLVCPSCRGGASRVEHLFDLPAGGHCGFCEISFDLPLDRAVEAVFLPSAAVRRLEPRPYCSGGPAATPHVVAQRMLSAGGATELVAPAEPDAYRLFVRGGAVAEVVVAEDGADRAAFVVGAEISPAAARVRPGARIDVRQVDGPTRHVKLERTSWNDRAATAHGLALNPEFRRIFSDEVLGPGRQLQVARVALLFSDLSGSTALYTRVGDAPAFRLVQDHFAHLAAAVAAHDGVVVKTIGDAVMAAFPDEGAAVRAAVSMQDSWRTFQAGRPDAADTLLKLGVHAGPAYVVTANGVLDYFGQTVNIAARLQGAAREGEIVLTDELAARAAEAAWLGPARVVERFDATLKGLDAPVRAARLAVPAR